MISLVSDPPNVPDCMAVFLDLIPTQYLGKAALLFDGLVRRACMYRMRNPGSAGRLRRGGGLRLRGGDYCGEAPKKKLKSPVNEASTSDCVSVCINIRVSVSGGCVCILHQTSSIVISQHVLVN